MTTTTNKSNKKPIIFIMVLYLLGIFMGAIDTGIVTPARTIIQTTLNIDSQLGIWMITIYTLSYAASIPIMGKIADKYGRKYIYLLSIFLFGLGSLLSGVSQYVGSFTMLLISRSIQAIGGGGIIPIATAEFGTTFPKEKRGVALGLVGGVYGIANIFGASAGSLILDIFGQTNWSYIFFINIPITIFILAFGFFMLPNYKGNEVKKIDIFGILFLTLMILSLLYGLKSIDFLHFGSSIQNFHVWLFILIAFLFFPLFLLSERKAEDPVINLDYFKNRQVVITLVLSFISGVILMGTIFVPQFAENSVRIASGSGGYYVIVLGLFAGVGAPLSGKLIDKFGVKPVLSFGFLISVFASLFVVFITIPYPKVFTVIISLIFIGLGLGFSLGTPLNYMMLENTDPKESNSALATLSLIRSIGTTIAPSIMVAFIASAGMLVQSNISEELPTDLNVPPVVYASEIKTAFDEYASNPQFSDSFGDFVFPDMTNGYSYPLVMNSSSDSSSIDPTMLQLIQSSDVTTVAVNTEVFYDYILNTYVPYAVSGIQSGVQSGIDALELNVVEMNAALQGLNASIEALTTMQLELLLLDQSSFDGRPVIELVSIDTVNAIPSTTLSSLSEVTTLEGFMNVLGALQGQKVGLSGAIAELNTLIDEMNAFKVDVANEFEIGIHNYLLEIENHSPDIENVFQSTINTGFRNIYLSTLSAAFIGFIVLRFYHSPKIKVDNNQSEKGMSS